MLYPTELSTLGIIYTIFIITATVTPRGVIDRLKGGNYMRYNCNPFERPGDHAYHLISHAFTPSSTHRLFRFSKGLMLRTRLMEYGWIVWRCLWTCEFCHEPSLQPWKKTGPNSYQMWSWRALSTKTHLEHRSNWQNANTSLIWEELKRDQRKRQTTDFSCEE